jgi:hypothetical protein
LEHGGAEALKDAKDGQDGQVWGERAKAAADDENREPV